MNETNGWFILTVYKRWIRGTVVHVCRYRLMKKGSTSVTRPGLQALPKIFILFAGLHFLLGAALGAWMAGDRYAISYIVNVHAEINPFGWLTMMIYGMTYAVLGVSAGLRLPWRWLGWLHFGMAETGILIVVVGILTRADAVGLVGGLLQAAAPVVFLVNILSAVFTSKRHRSSEGSAERRHLPAELEFLGRFPQLRDSDRIAQRGTDVALMAFLIAVLWAAEQSISYGRWTWLDMPVPAYLIMAGWIGGTLLAVSLHLFPRFFGIGAMPRGVIRWVQGLWGLSLVSAVLEDFLGHPQFRLANTMFAVALIILSVTYAWFLFRSARQQWRTTGPAALAWCGAFACAFALGIWLLTGQDLRSVAAMHLLFLGWATTLIYSVGYTLFPLFFHTPPVSLKWSYGQVIGSLVGTFLLIVGLQMGQAQSVVSSDFVQGLTGLGGLLAALSAYVFMGQWFWRRRGTARTPAPKASTPR
ncbi:hypothetical protein [Alicyclobacillus herbarius]|uniref:hypothetical protein n=1 Tax=Alicyclobacillus herbarius TaxID=122960 RepID=UPI0012DF8FD5|nr:hypothetical protein [Alicyclobacillus herbarius]